MLSQRQPFTAMPGGPAMPAQVPAEPASDVPDGTGLASRVLATVRRLGAFFWWIVTGFGLFSVLLKGKATRFKVEEIVVYSVHQSFFLWALIATGFIGSAVVRHYPNSLHVAQVWGWVYVWVLLYTFMTLLFDIGTLKFLLWSGILAFCWLLSKYVEGLRHVSFVSGITTYLRGLHPTLNAGFASVMSWLLLGPWLGALFHSFSRGRTTFSPNSIEEWHLGEGREITDRSGLKFRSRYRDLLEMVLGFGAGDLEAFDSEHRVTKRWDNILFLVFVWRRLDEILHQRSAVVDNAADDPVEVEAVRRPA